jgi:predicted outer membrane repeat protein
MFTYLQNANKIISLLIALMALGFGVNANAATYYVKASAANGGNGSSWSLAFNNLSSALNAAKLNAGPDQIWVAKGTYKPTTTCGNVAATFQIQSNVAIYGGFNGTETSINQRNRDVNPTVLSGDICNKGHPITIQTNYNNYSWHVLTVNGVSGVTLDSLIVSDGYAAGPDSGELDSTLPHQFVIKMLNQADDSGGGLLVRNGAHVVLNNMLFQYNASDATHGTLGGNPLLGSPAIASGGGAVAAVDNNTLVSMSNSLFQYNNAFVLGGNGGALNSLANASGFNITNSTFQNNTANRNGGAIHAKDSGAITVQSSSFLKNKSIGAALGDESGGALGIIDTDLSVSGSYFQDNVAGVLAGAGGAIFFHLPTDDGTAYTLTVNNCVFMKNQAFASGGGAINIFGIQPHLGSSASINNSLFVGNVAGVGGAVHNSSTVATISNSLFIGNQAWTQGGAVYDSNLLNVIVSDPSSDPGPIVRPSLAISKDIFSGNSIIGFPKNTVHCSFPVTVFPCTFTPTDFFNLVANAFGPFFGGPPSNVTAINQGGGAIGAGFSANVNVSESVFLNNTANSSPADDGGAILVGGTLGALLNTNPPGQGMNEAYVKLRDSAFFGNTAALGDKNTAVEDLGTPLGGVILDMNNSCTFN